MSSLGRELRFAIRSLRASRRLAGAALACIVIGTASAVFIVAVANAILFHRPPFPNADRLVRLWTVVKGTGTTDDVSYLDAHDVAERSRSFDALEMATRTRFAVTTARGTERVRGESVSSGYFNLIAVRPMLGRAFTAEEYATGAHPVVIISHALWLRAFGGRDDALGATFRARGSTGQDDDQLFTVIGVMPANFVGTVDPDVSDFWLPLEQYRPRRALELRTTRATWVLARLKPNVNLPAAQADVARISMSLAAADPDAYTNISLAIEPLGESWRARFRDGLAMLTIAAFLLLLIACANVSHLLLARLARQEHELRLRQALGATRGMIVRQLLIESSVLTFAGGGIGVGLAAWGLRIFAATGVFKLPPYVELRIDSRSAAFALVLVAATALLSGVLPAWLGGRVDASHLRASGRGTTLGKQQKRSIDGLVIAEVAFSFLVIAGSALMLRTYDNLLRAKLGYRTHDLLRMAVSLDSREFPDSASRLRFARDAKSALARQPGVRGVSFVAGVLPPWVDPVVALAVRGERMSQLASVSRHSVDEDFFRVLDIPIVYGRPFGTGDQPGSRAVAIVSRTLAKALAGDEQRAIGHTFEIASSGVASRDVREIEVVGVAEDVRYHGPLTTRTADNDLYLPLAQAPDAILSIALATAGDPMPMVPSLQHALSGFAHSSPIHWITTMESELGVQYGDSRLYAWLTAVFGGSAFLLVTIGIYGVISNAVARRLGELGVRMAVGATPRDIVTLVLRQAASPILIGLAIGVIAGFGIAPIAARLVYGIAATDLWTFVAVATGMFALGLCASYLPARRATRIDPLAVLRRS